MNFKLDVFLQKKYKLEKNAISKTHSMIQKKTISSKFGLNKELYSVIFQKSEIGENREK